MTPNTSLQVGLGRVIFALATLAAVSIPVSGQAALTSVDYRITGSELRVTPSVLSVPKNVAGSVLVEMSAGAEAVPAGAFVEATLRGPSFPARRVIGQVNQALLLPPLPIVGDYQLDGIRLVRVEGTNTVTLQEASPSSVPIRVFDEVLVSRVTSRPLTLEEIREKGIVIDDQNFRAVEFEIGFVLDGKTIPVRFPVVAPAFRSNTEIIPAAELEKRLAEAEAINNSIDLGSVLPPELETARLNIDIKGINFQFVDEQDVDLALQVPPIPALMVVPGNIGFLNQFFSVQIFTENAAPAGSGLSVVNVQARLKLPPGPDTIVSTNYNEPGDDPLRFARVGPDKIIQPIQPVVRPGPDGKTGTSDDILRLLPGEAGTGEFLVEGLQEGLHVMDLDLTADLEGLAAGIVKIKGKAAGSVLVRNPKFSLAFSHPRTVRAEEPYDLYVSVLNTSGTVANLVQVAMAAASISGGVLESEERVVLGTILPGQTLTAKFRIRAKRTGAISFSNITTSDDSVTGRFRLRGGFDDRGVALSPDTIAMPSYVTNLPPTLVDAANRVLGQALSVSTAGQLPAGVKSIGKSVITRRVLELAEAGQRVQYGDPLPRVLADILIDWQGGRSFNPGFDQIVRETDAGREWREALALHQDQDAADGSNAVARLAARLPDLAGRGEAWAIVALDSEAGTIRFGDGVNGRLPPESTNNLAPRYDHTNASTGLWFVDRSGTNKVFEWRPRIGVPEAKLALALIEADGTAQLLRWTVTNLSANACVRFHGSDTSHASHSLLIDQNCDGTPEIALAARVESTTELPPTLISVRQDPSVLVGRPLKICAPPLAGFPFNYATVVAVLFSKPMTQDRIDVPSAYTLENGNEAGSVQIQPGGRVALLNMRLPLGGLRERRMTVNGVTDPRGNTLVSNALPVLSNLRGGASIRGRVARADGSPAAAVPVTLTYYDAVSSGLGGCDPWIVRPGQVLTDVNGYFDFDFVVSGIPYSISATDTAGLTSEAIALILESTRADEFQRSKLLELASSASAQNTLLESFAVGALTDVVAKAEGLDRALLRDVIGGPREGTEVAVALRFRGRGSVTGRVVLADGVTPVPRAAVNLFPDPASRELGRGLFSDSDGRFAFLGVPLGIFSIEANSGIGLTRTIAGVIEQPGQATNVLIMLSSALVPRTDLTGRVTENDNVTPHSGAQVYVGKFDNQGKFCCVVSAPTTDSDGFWRASGIPADTYVLMAVSQDGRRKGERQGIIAPSGLTNFASIALQGFGVVIGRVETANGIPVVNAIVAGGEQLVRTTNNGTFRLTGVPTGLRSISAGAERSGTNGNITSPPFSFPRLGSAQVNVLPGVENFVVVRFDPKGSLIGRVVDETGTNAVTGINVALPEQGGFQWVPVNGRGEFFFEGIGLKKYVVSAPAPAVFNTDVSGSLAALGDPNSSVGQLQAAIGEAFAIFTGAADPLLNGEGAAFNPGRWGYVDTELISDGEVKNVTVQFFRSSTIAGKVLNGQGVPIGARVRLTGIGPSLSGSPITVIRGERNSDPALGTFEFPRSAFIGSYGLQSASPFFPVVITHSGFTTEIQPADTNVVLQFPATRDINGRLAGFVLNPDGSPAAPDVKVRIRSFDAEIRTRTNGFFDTQFALPAVSRDGVAGVGYSVEVEDQVNASLGVATAVVYPGVTNFVNVRLLGRGALRVTVLQNDGSPAAGARLGYNQGSYPYGILPLNEGPATDANGQALFLNLFEGSYGFCAQFVSGATVLRGAAGAFAARGQTNDIVIRLGPTGTIEGRFVKRDGVTPVTFAQVAVGSLAFATTDTNGFFRIADVPVGTYRLTSSDPVSGIGATLTTVLTFNGQTNVVRLIEQSRGEIRGAVIASDGLNFVPGATVTLTVSDGITPARTVTTGPDGRFSFPGSPAGSFQLFAQHPLTGLSGVNGATLSENAAFFEINVPLQPLAAISILVLRPDGATPATNVTVRFGGLTGDTDVTGRARFSELPLGDYVVTATSRVLSETRSIGRTNVTLAAPGTAPEVTIRLEGVGRVSGQVFLSNGSTPAAGAVVTLSHASSLQSFTFTTTTDGGGLFNISNVAVGPYLVSASVGTLGSRVAGSIAFDGEADVVSLTVEPSATVKGRLVRADGVTPVINEDVNLTLPGRNLPGALVRPGTNGTFEFTSLPLGAFRLQSIALRFNGIALREGTLAFNGQTNDVGNLVMDEDDPRVVSVSPPDTAVGVPITTQVQLVFNEALRSNSVEASGIYLQGPSNAIAASVQLLNDTNGVPRVVRLIPNAPLKSLTTYRIVVVDNIRQDAFGGVIGRGPRDLVERPLIAPFLSTFTTADNDPPELVSIFPTNGQIQIDPRAVMRMSFNEPIRETNFSLTLTGANGLVPGVASVGLNGLVLAFAPAAELSPNTTYTLAVSNVFDLAGNRAANEPFIATFSTLDTLGPEIAVLRVAGGRLPVAGSRVPIEALLAANEPGASVRFTQDLNNAGSDTNAPFQVDVTLPAEGSTTIRAIATDRFGNDGPLAEFAVSVVSNQPPTVTLTRVSPAAGPVFRGETFSLQVNATDDVQVTNVLVTVTGGLNYVTNLPGVGPMVVTLTVPTNAVVGSGITVGAQAFDFGGLIATTALELSVSNVNQRPVAGLVEVGAGNALELDGSNDSVSGVLLRDIVNDFTMELWVNPTASHRITSELASGAEAQGGMRYAVFPQLGEGFGCGNCAGAGISVGTNGISVAEHAGSYIPTLLVHQAPVVGWTHVAVVYQGRQPTLYTNGVLARRGLTSARDVRPSANISEFPPYGGYQGQVDELRVWRTVRDERAIRETMNRRLAGNEPGLAGYWRFDETNGVAVLNAVTNANHFTLAPPPAQPVRVSSAAPVRGGALITNTSAALLTLDLAGADPEGDPITAVVTALPARGVLFQTVDGTTPAAAITSVPTLVLHPGRLVIFKRQVGYTGPDEFRYFVHDGRTNSIDAFVYLDLVTPPDLDTDGDGLPDRYEIANNLNPEANDASLDADGDGLINLDEFQAGTNPRNPDTDGDGLRDAIDFDPLQASAGGELVISTYAHVTDPIQLSFAPDGTLFAGRDVFGSGGSSADPTRIHRIAPGGAPVVEYGNAVIGDPDGVAFDVAGMISGVAGSVLVAGSDGSGGFIRAIRPDQSIVPVFGPSASFGNPGSAKFDRNGRLLFLEMSEQQGVWASSGGPPTLLIPLSLPQHMVVDAANRIFVSDRSGTLSVYSSTGTLLKRTLASGLRQFFFDVGPGGFFGTNLWGVDINGRLLGVNPVTGAVIELATGLGNLCVDATFGPDGALYISQFDQDRVLRIAPLPGSCAPLPTGAVAWWAAEDSFADSVSGFAGSPSNGVSFATGQVGRAFRFDGVNAFVSVPDGPQWDFGQGDFAIEFWVKLDRLKDSMFIHQQSGSVQGGFEFDLQVDDVPPLGNDMLVFARDNNEAVIARPWTPETNRWYHLAVTRRLGAYRMFVDGVQLGADEFSANPVADVTGPVRIGSWAGGNYELAGLMDEIAVYRRALNVSEIRTIVAAGSLGKCPPTPALLPTGAVAWWSGDNSFTDQVGAVTGVPAGGAGFTNSIVGSAFRLDGVDDEINLGNEVGNFGSNDFTVEFWVQSTANRSEAVLSKRPICDFSSFWNVFIDRFGIVAVEWCGGPAPTFNVAAANRPINDGQFHHVAWQRRGTNASIWVDGLLGGATGAPAVSLSSSAPLLIGGNPCVGLGAFRFTGRLDELTFYSRALAPEEMRSIASAGPLGKVLPDCAPLPSGAIAWWPAENTPHDLLAGQPGTLFNGGGFTNAGYVGSAFTLDGVDDFVDVGPLAGLDNATGITVAAWVKRQRTDSTVGGIIGKWDSTGGANENTFLLYNGENAAVNRGSFFVGFANGGHGFVNGTTPMNRDQWYHVAATWRSSDGQLTIHKNGILERSINVGAGQQLRAHRAYTAKVGEWGILRDSTFKWPGLIDEVLVLNRALGSNEIAAIYAARTQGICLPAPSDFAALANLDTNPGRAIRVLTLNSNVAGLCNGEPMGFASPRYETLRADLLDRTRFSPTGTVSRSIQLLPAVARLSIQSMTNADVILLQSGSYSSTERALLVPFTQAGGGILAYGNDAANAVADLVGARAGGFTGTAQATVAGNASPVTAGPFGTVGPGTVLPVGFAGSFEPGSLGANASIVMNNDAGVFAAAFSLGADAGRVVAFCDEELFINAPSISPCFSAHLGTASRAMFLNALAHVMPLPPAGGGAPPAGAPVPRITDLVVASGDASSMALTLHWSSAHGQRFTVEESVDLINWQPTPAAVTEAAPGVLRAVLPVRPVGNAFFRVRTIQ